MKLIILFLLSIAVYSSAFECGKHTMMGIPISSNKINDVEKILCREGYVLGYDYQSKNSLWTMHYVTKKQVLIDIKRVDKFEDDFDVLAKFRSTEIDYDEPNYSLGHLVSYDVLDFNENSALQSFLMTNVSPQNQSLNSGAWKALENREQKFAKNINNVLIIGGAIFENHNIKIGENKVHVPTHFYKIFYDPIAVRAIGFILPNKPTYTRELENHIYSVDEIEKVTGFDFLTSLDDSIENKIEKIKSKMWKWK